MHFRLFSLFQKKTNCYSLTHHTWKMSPHYLVKCTTFSSDWRYAAFVQSPNIGGSEKKPVVGWHWWRWKEPAVVCGKWNVRQTTLRQMLKVTTFCTDICFQSFPPLINCIIHHAMLKFSPCHNASTTRSYRELVLSTCGKKDENLCILQGSAVTFFRCGGKGVTVYFLLRLLK